MGGQRVGSSQLSKQKYDLNLGTSSVMSGFPERGYVLVASYNQPRAFAANLSRKDFDRETQQMGAIQPSRPLL
jgi:hypothetical protein